MGFATDLDVLGSCSPCQIANGELFIGHGSTPPMVIIRVLLRLVRFRWALPPRLLRHLLSRCLREAHQRSIRNGREVDDVCAKWRVKEPSPPLGSGSTAGSPLHQTLTNDGELGGESWLMKGRASQPPSALTTAPSSPQITATLSYCFGWEWT